MLFFENKECKWNNKLFYREIVALIITDQRKDALLQNVTYNILLNFSTIKRNKKNDYLSTINNIYLNITNWVYK